MENFWKSRSLQGREEGAGPGRRAAAMPGPEGAEDAGPRFVAAHGLEGHPALSGHSMHSPQRVFGETHIGGGEITYPKWGPPFIRSKTWAGLRNCLNLRRNLTPWLSPLLELTKASRGLEQEDGQVAFQKPGFTWGGERNFQAR